MSTKNKSKSQKLAPMEGDNQPYYHPVLEKQMIIRFPPDVAARMAGMMEDERFEDFTIKFKDEHHAVVKVFGEKLDAVLVSLPTIVETHRTVDGSHLFKSADIGEILIVYRKGSSSDSTPPGVNTKDFTYDHGLTPPTQRIRTKRAYRQDIARDQQQDSEVGNLDGIEYWEMVEIQLHALLSKDGSAKPICRHEIFEEPDEDPVELEKALRRAGYSQYKGYSGQNIDDSEIDATPSHEPIITIPDEIIDEVAPQAAPASEDEDEEALDLDNLDLGGDDLNFEDHGDAPPAEEAEPAPEAEQRESANSSSDSSSESEEEEDDNEEDELATKMRAREHIVSSIENLERTLAEGRMNDLVATKTRRNLENMKAKLQQLDKEIEMLKNEKEEESD